MDRPCAIYPPMKGKKIVCQQRPRGINLRSFPGRINSLANLSLFVDFSALILKRMDFELLDGISSSWQRDAVSQRNRRRRYGSPFVSLLFAFPLPERISFPVAVLAAAISDRPDRTVEIFARRYYIDCRDFSNPQRFSKHSASSPVLPPTSANSARLLPEAKWKN